MTKLPERKKQRLSGYNYNQNNRYFITICTLNRKCILSDIKIGDLIHPADVILTATGKIVEKYIRSSENMNGFTVEKYVIMPNHIHLLIGYLGNDGSSRAPTPTNSAIPRYVSVLKRLVNYELGQNIWQRGYYDHIIRNESDYRAIWEYIDTNPTRWADDKYYPEVI